ncbi:MAG: hypothetical protein ACI915_001502 [Gammaproteobacteria bacterium]
MDKRTELAISKFIVIRRGLYLVLVAVFLSGCSGTEQEFANLPSPDGTHVLIVTVTKPLMPHARHIVTVYVRRGDTAKPQKLTAVPLENDGVPFTDQNIGLRWTGVSRALVCLRPTDLPDQGVRVNVADAPIAEVRPGC